MRKIFEQEKQGKAGGPEKEMRKEKERVEKGIIEIKEIVSTLINGQVPEKMAIDGSTHSQINDLKRIVPYEMQKINQK